MPAVSAAVPRPPAAIIVMGVSGSGKTEVGRLLARDLGSEFLDADDHHPPENVELMRRGIPLDDAHRAPWLARLAELVDAAVARAGRDAASSSGGPPPATDPPPRGVVLACSALKRSYRDRIGAGRPGVRLVHLDGPEELIRKRIEQRSGHFMPVSLLASQCALLERPQADEAAITVGIDPPPAEIVRRIRRALAAE